MKTSRVLEYLKSDRGIMPLFDVWFWIWPACALWLVIMAVGSGQ
jgi:hypothetical protein